MDKFLGGVIWLLGGLSVVWTVLAIVLLASTPADCTVCSVVVRGHVDSAAGDWAMWLMAQTAINWLVMTFLDVIFVYLVAASLYRHHLCMPSFPPITEVPNGEG